MTKDLTKPVPNVTNKESGEAVIISTGVESEEADSVTVRRRREDEQNELLVADQMVSSTNHNEGEPQNVIVLRERKLLCKRKLCKCSRIIGT